MLTEKQQREIELGWKRGNDCLLEITRAKTGEDQWMVGACLAARARVRIVLAALEANAFFTVWVPVWLERAQVAADAGRHERAAYYRCLANAGRDAQFDAMRSARGLDMQKTIIFDNGIQL